MDLTKEDFNVFIKYLEAISKQCSDCEIRNGLLRIRSDNRAIFYLLQLPEIFKETSFGISSISNFVSIMKIFNVEDNDHLTFNINDRDIEIFDEVTKINLDKPEVSLLQNKFITDEELQKAGITNSRDVFKLEVSDIILERIFAISKNFAVTTFLLQVKNSQVKLLVTSESKTRRASFQIEPDIMELPDGIYTISNLIFDFPFENVTLKIEELPNKKFIVTSSDGSNKIVSGVIVDEL